MLRYLERRLIYRLRYLLEEAAVAKIEKKIPGSDRQAREAPAVSTRTSYWLSLFIEIPRMQAGFATVSDGILNLRESYAGCSVVDIAVIVGQIECSDDGRSQVIILRQLFVICVPCFKKSIGIECGTSFGARPSLLKHHVKLI